MDGNGAMSNIAEFEKVFEDLDVKTEEMNTALDGVSGSSMDNGEVMALLQQMQAENAMNVNSQVGQTNDNAIGQYNPGDSNAQGVPQQPMAMGGGDDMQARLDALKKM